MKISHFHLLGQPQQDNPEKFRLPPLPCPALALNLGLLPLSVSPSPDYHKSHHPQFDLFSAHPGFTYFVTFCFHFFFLPLRETDNSATMCRQRRKSTSSDSHCSLPRPREKLIHLMYSEVSWSILVFKPSWGVVTPVDLYVHPPWSNIFSRLPDMFPGWSGFYRSFLSTQFRESAALQSVLTPARGNPWKSQCSSWAKSPRRVWWWFSLHGGFDARTVVKGAF